MNKIENAKVPSKSEQILLPEKSAIEVQPTANPEISIEESLQIFADELKKQIEIVKDLLDDTTTPETIDDIFEYLEFLVSIQTHVFKPNYQVAARKKRQLFVSLTSSDLKPEISTTIAPIIGVESVALVSAPSIGVEENANKITPKSIPKFEKFLIKAENAGNPIDAEIYKKLNVSADIIKNAIVNLERALSKSEILSENSSSQPISPNFGFDASIPNLGKGAQGFISK